jgi:hypothetical protein
MTRTPEEEQRAGVRLIIVGLGVLAVMLTLWWLVARTNSEGDHDAELLSLFALIPLLLGSLAGCEPVLAPPGAEPGAEQMASS